jgi:hypothetical protein
LKQQQLLLLLLRITPVATQVYRLQGQVRTSQYLPKVRNAQHHHDAMLGDGSMVLAVPRTATNDTASHKLHDSTHIEAVAHSSRCTSGMGVWKVTRAPAGLLLRLHCRAACALIDLLTF